MLVCWYVGMYVCIDEFRRNVVFVACACKDVAAALALHQREILGVKSILRRNGALKPFSIAGCLQWPGCLSRL